MCEKIRKYPVVSSFLTVLTAFALLKGMPGSGRAAEIIKLAVLSAAMLYIMYLASGKEIFRWEKGSLGKSIRLYKSMLIISFIIVAFTIIGHLADPSEMVRKDCWIGLLTLIPHTLSIGLFEESAFRGVLMGGILAQTDGSRKGVFLALTVSGLVFGFLHVILNITFNMSAAEVIQAVSKTLETGMMGFVIGAVYLVTKNIWAAAILHGGVDYALMAIAEIFGQELNGYVDAESNLGSAGIQAFIVIGIKIIPMIAAIRIVNKMSLPQRGMWKET